MTIWLLLIFSVLISANPKEAQYECGEHGRFEYCIDGIPGCIIGCHCHPGYYFDTDTKICEPNSKLLQTYRRQYAEPTRIPLSQMDYPELMPQTTSFPSPNVLDDHVDNIAKNADDLGDWLYNQFYKTIENQVINNTNENVITRRSGKGNNLKTSKKKRRKSEKKGSTKNKLKQDDLRRKLLRITEDDSLFDSDSEIDSSDASSSKEEDESDDKDHGHKKFVILNKKPKPPLPSFVFLPNIETPFYPPVGLPPPVLPMYPMVPVPPVLPAYPLPNAVPDCDEKSSTLEASSSPTIISTITTVSTAASTGQPSEAETTTNLITTVSEEPGTLRKNKRQKKLIQKGANDSLRRLRQLIQTAGLNKTQRKAQVDPLEETDQESVDIQETLQIDPLGNADLQYTTNNKSPLVDDDIANFKYLSQLIHRVNLNDTDITGASRLKPSVRNRKPLIINPKKSRISVVPSNLETKIGEPRRRFNIEMYPQEPKTSDDTFYSKLGKQIATLIRGVDSKNNRQIDIEIEHLDQNTPSYPIFSELSYAPHSYWERFARSPKNYLEQYRKKHEHCTKSNELLYNIENKVKIAASTMLPMSLREIENFIKGIPETRDIEDDIEKFEPHKYHQSCNNSLNINLWPEEPPTFATVTSHAKPVVNKSLQSFNYTKKNTSDNHSKLKGFRMRNVYATWIDADHSPYKTPDSKIQNIRLEKISDDKNKKIIITKLEIPISKQQKKIPNYGNIPVRQFTLTPTRRSNKVAVHQALSPFDYNKKFVDDNNPFYDKTEEFKYPTIENSANKPVSRTKRPSYFHHEVHHFNYID